jgi:hypothetical protein
MYVPARNGHMVAGKLPGSAETSGAHKKVERTYVKYTVHLGPDIPNISMLAILYTVHPGA